MNLFGCKFCDPETGVCDDNKTEIDHEEGANLDKDKM